MGKGQVSVLEVDGEGSHGADPTVQSRGEKDWRAQVERVPLVVGQDVLNVTLAGRETDGIAGDQLPKAAIFEFVGNSELAESVEGEEAHREDGKKQQVVE